MSYRGIEGLVLTVSGSRIPKRAILTGHPRGFFDVDACPRRVWCGNATVVGLVFKDKLIYLPKRQKLFFS